MSTQADTSALQHVEDVWDDAVADALDPVERLVYRSNLLGSDWRITNTGGGNTSAKLTETDPITGQDVEVLWVKGSGGDLRTAEKANFASLYQDQVLALQEVYQRFPERGLKTPAEDAMVAMYPHTTFDLNPRAPSIDTPLHSFIPYKHVDHMHPVAVIAIATASNGPELTKKVYGDDVVWTDWMRPGFELGLEMERICRENPRAKGILMGGHGLINWADDDKECYQLTLRLIDPGGGVPHRARRGPGRVRRRPRRAPRGRRPRRALDRRAAVASGAVGERRPHDRDGRDEPGRGRLRELEPGRRTGRAGHVVPGPLSADQDQAAPRGLGPGLGRRRHAPVRPRRRAAPVPRGLPGVLRRLQGLRLAPDARRRPDGRPRPRRGG